MRDPKTLSITDDSSLLAIVNADKYNSFVNAQWEFPELSKRFVDEMNNENLIVWSTDFENIWTLSFVTIRSDKKSFREFSKTITVTAGQLFLTNYEDLTMSAQYVDEKIPAAHNADLSIELDNGTYQFTIRQLFNPTNYEKKAEFVDFEIVVQKSIKAIGHQVDKIFWWTR